MSENKHESPRDFVLSPSVLAMLLAASGSIGGAATSFFEEQLEREAVQACFDNSKTALEAVSQHGERLTMQTGKINRLREYVDQKTAYPYSAKDAFQDGIDQGRRDSLQDQRLDWLEGQHRRDK